MTTYYEKFTLVQKQLKQFCQQNYFYIIIILIIIYDPDNTIINEK